MSSWYRTRHSNELADTTSTEALEPEAEPAQANPLDSMTKAELLAYAQECGISPANNDMTKAEIRASIDNAAL